MIAVRSPGFEPAVRCAIALGSNLGDSLAILAGAIAALDAMSAIQIMAVSPWFRTAPIGPPQPDYVNGCAILATSLEPLDLLDALLLVETQFGRERRERWGARTLDLDLLLYGDRLVDLPRLTVPHPQMAERGFVLLPLAEIAADWVDPRSGRSIQALADWVDGSGVTQI
jgi:2-amino-4-hydroxy-6-hydroxymethyldihydropteridine diphosphokinase